MNDVRWSILKTTSIPRCSETTTTGFLTYALVIALAPLVCSFASAQTPLRNSTPDPYFNQNTQSRATETRPPLTAGKGPTNQFISGFPSPQSKSNSALRDSFQRTNPPLRRQFNEPEPGGTEIWDAPLTPIAKSNSQNPPPSTSQFLAPIKTTTGPASSIIREPQTNSTDFSSRSGGSFNSQPQLLSRKSTSTPQQQGTLNTNPAPTQVSQQPDSPIKNSKPNNDFQLKPPQSFTLNPPKTAPPKTAPLKKAPSVLAPSPKTQQKLASRSGVPKRTPPQPPNTTAQPHDEFESFEPGKVLALVGGEPIFVADLLFDINQVIEKYLPTAPENIKKRERQKMIPQLLPRFVESKLLYHGMLQQLPDEVDMDKVIEQATSEFDEKALKTMLKNSGLNSASEFDAHLRAQGSSLRSLRQSWARDQLTKYFLGQQLKVETEVTHQQMLDVYRKNIDSYAVKAKVRWEQIMIRFDRSSSRAEAQNQITELRDQVVFGANLAAVAKKKSQGFMASSGGQQDWTTKNALVLKEIDRAIFSLPVGELSDIIESKDGYHIIRVIERTEASRTPFLEAQVDIKKQINNENRNEALKEHLAKLRDEIPVEYFYDDPTKVAEIKSGSLNR
ncbi:MAG: peptidylprolyl isomerase [Mariniblastus sp.]|nr:peptidylprolyl isomerase [Mariniblastus sp.]